MTQFRKKPVVIEAFQMTEARRMDNAEWPEWLNRAWNKNEGEPGAVFRKDMDATMPDLLCIWTLEGVHLVDWGDWIIRGVKGELYPCKPGIFAATYELAAPQPAQPADHVADASKMVPLDMHFRFTAGPAPWTNTRVPTKAWDIARAVYGTSTLEDEQRVYRTVQATLHALATPKFERTHCSQCGGEFGPGNAGFSHCADHAQPAAQAVAADVLQRLDDLIAARNGTADEWDRAEAALGLSIIALAAAPAVTPPAVQPLTPLTDEQIDKLLESERMRWSTRSGPPTYEFAAAFARAIERAHGIGTLGGSNGGGHA